nr:hypothetical protein [Tanacetum cinerariifolium]
MLSETKYISCIQVRPTATHEHIPTQYSFEIDLKKNYAPRQHASQIAIIIQRSLQRNYYEDAKTVDCILQRIVDPVMILISRCVENWLIHYHSKRLFQEFERMKKVKVKMNETVLLQPETFIRNPKEMRLIDVICNQSNAKRDLNLHWRNTKTKQNLKIKKKPIKAECPDDINVKKPRKIYHVHIYMCRLIKGLQPGESKELDLENRISQGQNQIQSFTEKR